MSELEGVVIGLAAVDPGRTPYAIRQFFLKSPSPSWSGSAGAIYPLVRRLEARGLLRRADVATGRRKGAVYDVTAKGRAALGRWLRTSMDKTVLGVPVDPLRTRLRFLHLVPRPDRVALIARALGAARAQLPAIHADCRAKRTRGDLDSYLTARGALLMMQARIAWLRELARAHASRWSSRQ